MTAEPGIRHAVLRVNGPDVPVQVDRVICGVPGWEIRLTLLDDLAVGDGQGLARDSRGTDRGGNMAEREIDVAPEWHRRRRKAWRQAALLLGDLLRAISAADDGEITWLTSGGRRIAAIVPDDDAEYLAGLSRGTSLSGRISGTAARVSMRGMPEGLEPGTYRVGYEDAKTEDGVLTLHFRYVGREPEPHAGPVT